ncbi:hypothetical protein [Jidongwangia harbinensis]|uniref:hypothetical protein n=1 Tax=Jidongwangia harbinensis TaxID=2878561 RepID=UPI00355851FD
MATPVKSRAELPPAGFAAVSRAVVAVAAELVGTVERAVVGDANVRTARGNAWDALCADRARAQAREEMDQLVRMRLANHPRSVVSTQPAAAESPVAQPTATGSPATQPATTGSPATQPPTTGSPATQPPTTESPVAQPTAGELGDGRPGGERSAAGRSAPAASRTARTRPAGQNRSTGQHQPAAKTRRGGKGQRAVGSSPRSKASQTALVSTGSSAR